MPRMHGASRALVAVSLRMEALRDIHLQINRFIWSTQLSYGLVLTSADARLQNRDQVVSQSLADVYELPWYPYDASSIRYDARISGFFRQLLENRVILYRATLVSWHSQFENHLTRRLREHIRRKTWGPFTVSLRCAPLVSSPSPIRPTTILRADLCRLIRNQVVHTPQDLPEHLSDRNVAIWKEQRSVELSQLWELNPSTAATLVDEAAAHLVGEAVKLRADFEKRGHNVPIEHFYTLSSLKNLDALACEIEEALLPAKPRPAGRIARELKTIRRHDLVVPSIVKIDERARIDDAIVSFLDTNYGWKREEVTVKDRGLGEDPRFNVVWVTRSSEDVDPFTGRPESLELYVERDKYTVAKTERVY